MTKIIDTSVLIRFFNRELGWEKALEVLKEETCMSSVNLAEFFTWCNRNSWDLEQAEELFETLEIQVMGLNSKLAKQIGKLYKDTHQLGLSLGDRACLALGQKLQVPIVTCDKVWESLTIEWVIVEII